MEVKEMQTEALKVIEDWNKKNNMEHNKDTVFLHLIEEIGELATELNHKVLPWRTKYNKENLDKEYIDVLIQLLIFARDQDINIEETFKKKIAELRERFELDGD